MLRNPSYRPRLVSLEDRVAPGTVIGTLDTSLALTLGPALSASLDQDHTDQVVPANVGASDSTTTAGTGDLTSVNGQAQSGRTGQSMGDLLTPALNSLGNQDVLNQIHLMNGLDGNGQAGADGGTVVNIGILPNSSISTGGGQFSTSFGDDPAIDGWDNVFVGSDTTVAAAQSDFHIRSATFVISGFHFVFQLSVTSDLSGSYDTGSGSATLSFGLSAQVTSPDAPGFDNNNCIIPATQLNLTTDTDQGVQFSQDDQGREVGVVIDNQAPVAGIPHGACGSFIGLDYADTINGNLGIPSAAGQNVFNLHLSLDQPIGP